MDQKKVCIAIIGAGYMAREHIRAFQDITGVKIAGITSRTISRAEALASEFQIPLVCKSIEELNEKTKADIVVITVPELSANPVSRACFEFPWTILMEKPAGYNFTDASDIEAASKSKKAKVFVAFNRRYYSSTQNVLGQMQSIQSLRYIRVQDQEDQKGALKAGQPKTVVANWMYANSVHLVDYFTFLGRGQVSSVESIIPWNAESPWVVSAKINFSSGDIGLYEGIWDGPGPWLVNVYTKEKRWEMRPLEQAAFQIAGERKMQAIEPHPWDQQFKPGLRLQAEKVVASLVDPKTDLPTLTDSLQSMKLVKQIFGL